VSDQEKNDFSDKLLAARFHLRHYCVYGVERSQGACTRRREFITGRSRTALARRRCCPCRRWTLYRITGSPDYGTHLALSYYCRSAVNTQRHLSSRRQTSAEYCFWNRGQRGVDHRAHNVGVSIDHHFAHGYRDASTTPIFSCVPLDDEYFDFCVVVLATRRGRAA